MKIKLLIIGYCALIQFCFSAIGFSAPKWKDPVIVFPDAIVNQPYSLNLMDYVENAGEEDLTFSFLEPITPSFLSLTSTGILTGVPQISNVGKYKFKVMVVAEDSGDIAQANLEVRRNPLPPVWPLTCTDGTDAHLVGSTPDRRYDLFACPR